MRRLIIAALFAAVATPAWAQQKMEKPGITNFTKVDAVVACGGATQTAALEGLKNDGFKSVINLRQASENGANIDENRAKATELGLKYIHIPLNAAAPENKTVDDFLGGGQRQVESAGVHPLRFGEPRGRCVAGEARLAGRLAGGESDRRGEVDRAVERAARAVRAQVHRGA